MPPQDVFDAGDTCLSFLMFSRLSWIPWSWSSSKGTLLISLACLPQSSPSHTQATKIHRLPKIPSLWKTFVTSMTLFFHCYHFNTRRFTLSQGTLISDILTHLKRIKYYKISFYISYVCAKPSYPWAFLTNFRPTAYKVSIRCGSRMLSQRWADKLQVTDSQVQPQTLTPKTDLQLLWANYLLFLWEVTYILKAPHHDFSNFSLTFNNT